MIASLAQNSMPPPDAIRRAAEDVISRDHFELGNPSSRVGGSLLLDLVRWLLRPFEWLFDSMEGWPDSIRWAIVILCIVLLVALVAHMIYSLVTAIRGPKSQRILRYEPAHVEVDPIRLEEEAERAGASGNYIEAVRLLFRAALRRIEVAEQKKLRPGFTNRELLRRYRSTGIFRSLERFVEIIDSKWYGGEACVREDYQLCRSEHARILEYVHKSRNPHGT